MKVLPCAMSHASFRLAFLAPPLVEMIAQGRQPAELTEEMMTRRTVLPLEW